MDAAPPSTARRRFFAIVYAVAGLGSVPLSWLSFDSGHTDIGGVLALGAVAFLLFSVVLLRGRGDWLIQWPLTRLRGWYWWTLLVLSLVNLWLRLSSPQPDVQPWALVCQALIIVLAIVMIVRASVTWARNRARPPT